MMDERLKPDETPPFMRMCKFVSSKKGKAKIEFVYGPYREVGPLGFWETFGWIGKAEDGDTDGGYVRICFDE